MKKALSVAMLTVGTVIGAGFASGQEIAVFFLTPVSLVAPVITGALFFLGLTLFLSLSNLGANNVQQLNGVIAKKFFGVFNGFLIFNAFVVLASTLAAFDFMGAELFVSAPIYSVFFALLCALVISRGIGGLIKCNAVIVPLIILIIAIIGINNLRHSGLSGFNVNAGVFPRSLIYVSMNMLLASTTVSTLGKLSRREIILSALFASAIITALMFLIVVTVNSCGNVSVGMPLLYSAGSVHPVLKAAVYVVVAISVFTTMIAAAHTLYASFLPIINDKFFTLILVFSAAFAVSRIGFTKVVELLYPVIGVLGLIYAFVALRFKMKQKGFEPLARDAKP